MAGKPVPGGPGAGKPVPGGPGAGGPGVPNGPGGPGGPGIGAAKVAGRAGIAPGPGIPPTGPGGFPPEPTAVASVPIGPRATVIDRPGRDGSGRDGFDGDGFGRDRAVDGESSQEILTANLIHRPASRATLLYLFGLVVVLLVVLPGILVLTSGGKGSAFGAVNSLGAPSWANRSAHDEAIYSRFCVTECQISERDASSTKSVSQTQATYADKLRGAGWMQTSAADCTAKVAGSYTCWTLDQRELDLWVRPSPCTLAAPPATETGVPGTAPSVSLSAGCDPTAVQIKIFDQIERSRVRTGASG